jgi:hypothetical protein
MNMINSRESVRWAMRLCVVTALAFVTLPSTHRDLAAQSLSYTSGQPVSPAFEGWEEDEDGTRYFVFGYMNKNWEEELDVPIGSGNGFSPGEPDRGQPTHFLPRRNRFVFRVQVPAGFSNKDELVWTLTTHGKTTKAYASLRTDYLIDDVVKASETGALGAGTSNPTVRSNKPPTVRIEGPANRTAKVGEPVSLIATIADDGIPRARSRDEFLAILARRAQASSPLGALFGGGGGNAASRSSPASAGDRSAEPGQPAAPAASAVPPALAERLFLRPPSRITVGKNIGLHGSWFVYRGAGQVQFEPAQIKSWEDTRAGANSPWAPIWFAPPLPPDGKITTQVSFGAPGTYVLRALADDGALTAAEDVTIVVTSATPTR